MLGGDPASVQTKRAASDQIDRLLRARSRSWPLDPDRLAQRGAEAADTDKWESAHRSLLAGLRLDLQEHVHLSLANIRRKLSDPLGPDGSRQSHGPKEAVHKAEEDLHGLEIMRKWPQARPKQREPAPPPPPDDWLGLASTFAVLVVLEAAANIRLLNDALPGGLLGAFILAVLVSAINVGGIGISAGLLLSTLRGRLADPARNGLYRTAWAAWGLSAFGFNFLAGRHRESYALVADEVSRNPEAAPPLPRTLLGEVGGPLQWDFKTQLFALLGLLLCAWGCAKGFNFRKRAEDPGDTDDVADESADGVFSHDPAILSDYRSLPKKYRRMLMHDLRERVSSYYRTVDEELRSVAALLDVLKSDETMDACVDRVEHAFIVAHNAASLDKIDRESVVANRPSDNVQPLTLPGSDTQVLEEAAALVAKWKTVGQAEFDERLDDAYNNIRSTWTDYRPIVLGEPRQVVGSGEVEAP